MITTPSDAGKGQQEGTGGHADGGDSGVSGGLLPFPLDGLGMKGCALQTSIELALLSLESRWRLACRITEDTTVAPPLATPARGQRGQSSCDEDRGAAHCAS